jgi:hypothetical protein
MERIGEAFVYIDQLYLDGYLSQQKPFLIIVYPFASMLMEGELALPVWQPFPTTMSGR